MPPPSEPWRGNGVGDPFPPPRCPRAAPHRGSVPAPGAVPERCGRTPAEGAAESLRSDGVHIGAGNTGAVLSSERRVPPRGPGGEPRPSGGVPGNSVITAPGGGPGGFPAVVTSRVTPSSGRSGRAAGSKAPGRGIKKGGKAADPSGTGSGAGRRGLKLRRDVSRWLRPVSRRRRAEPPPRRCERPRAR